ncbi:TPA: hypothetical protein ACSHS0_002788, partial [Legionella pneumophila]
ILYYVGIENCKKNQSSPNLRVFMPNEETTVSNELGGVSGKVLEKFIDKLASDAECSEIAARLKAIVFSEKVSEKSLQKAIFGEENS